MGSQVLHPQLDESAEASQHDAAVMLHEVARHGCWRSVPVPHKEYSTKRIVGRAAMINDTLPYRRKYAALKQSPATPYDVQQETVHGRFCYSLHGRAWRVLFALATAEASSAPAAATRHWGQRWSEQNVTAVVAVMVCNQVCSAKGSVDAYMMIDAQSELVFRHQTPS